jgi:hypothetical protein
MDEFVDSEEVGDAGWRTPRAISHRVGLQRNSTEK